jgi:repressor LexA
MTRRQLQLLRYVRSCLDGDGVSPSFEEIRVALQLKSKSGVHRIVNALVETGELIHRPNRARSLALPEAFLGNVATDRLVAELESRGWRKAV